MKKDNLYVIYITKNCNLRCDYCYEGLEKSNEKIDNEILKQLIDDIIDNASANETIKVLFFGGEVFLNESALFYGLDYVMEKHNQGVNIIACMTTNATLLNMERIRRLFKYHKILKVEVSFDGRKQTHDKYRCFKSGIGSYDIIYKNCKSLLKYFPFSTVRMVVSDADDMYEDAMFLADFGFKEFCIQGLRGELCCFTPTSFDKFKSEIKRIEDNFKTRRLTKLVSYELPHVIIDDKLTFVKTETDDETYNYFMPNGDAIKQNKFNEQGFEHFSKGKDASYNLLKGDQYDRI